MAGDGRGANMVQYVAIAGIAAQVIGAAYSGMCLVDKGQYSSGSEKLNCLKIGINMGGSTAALGLSVMAAAVATGAGVALAVGFAVLSAAGMISSFLDFAINISE